VQALPPARGGEGLPVTTPPETPPPPPPTMVPRASAGRHGGDQPTNPAHPRAILSRRRLLKLGLGVGVVAGAAGLAAWSLLRHRPAATGRAVLSTDEVDVVVALAETYFPRGTSLGASAFDVDVAAVVDGYVAGLLPRERRGLRALLRGLDAWPVVSATSTSPFSRLTVAERVAVLRAFDASAILERRLLGTLFRQLVGMAMLEDERVLSAIGHRHGCGLPVWPSEPPPLPLAVAAGGPPVAPYVQAATTGSLACDVVVIGTGAGGAAAGVEFARAGRKVVFLEAGDALWARDFARRSLPWSLTRLWASRGAQTSSSRPVVLVPSGRVVGGSTVLNSAICFKPPEKRLREWCDVTGSRVFEPSTFGPIVDEIWTRIGVAPTHAGIGRTNNLLFQKGCLALGFDHSWMDRNAPGCVGCGVCQLGCPSGGKASVDKSLLPEAVNRGATILKHARARAVVVEGGRATGVEVDVVDPLTEQATGSLKVRADVVVVAGGALFSPLLLQASGIRNAHLGQHLAIHPGVAALGEFDAPVVVWDGVPQGYYARCPDDEHALLETANAGPAELFSLLSRPGDEASVHRLAHLSMAGAMIRDSGLGSVELDDDEGVPRPRFSIAFSERDFVAFRAGARAIVRAWFAAGARRVAPGVTPLRFVDSEAAAFAIIDELVDAAHLAQPYGSHPHGTCRMGPRDGPHAGVVDDHGGVHGIAGLFVMDGSVLPTTLGVNPQVTIMATATMLARRQLA
jgi:choline dehydrogenase-like flavoprotein